ncbi:MAG TPA: VOC family protein [Burkholderiaceae bacterium]|nr:VOC family protein [Burkholderiaceae bacterium]
MVDLLVNIDVDDLDRAIAFYTGAFELRIGRRFGADGAELLGAVAPIYLLVKAEGSRPSPASTQFRDYRRHWTPIHLDVVVADIEAAVARAMAAGASLERAVQTSNWGKLALLADPFGNGFCLVEFLGRGYDEIAGS